jgi:hypothetical protein
MKFLSFNFCHPFKGYASLIRSSKTLSKSYHLIIDSKNSHSFEIPVGNCEDGEWKITLDWKLNYMSYHYEKIFNMTEANASEIEAC